MAPYYQDGAVTIYHGDSREILPQLEGVDTMLTDPPYGISLVPQRRITQSIKGDDRRDAKALLWFCVPYLYEMLPADAVAFFFAGWSEIWVKEILDSWFTVKSCIVWRKNRFGIGYHTRPQHEFLYLCHKGEPPLPTRPTSDVWDEDAVVEPQHSCEKPVRLLERALLYYGNAQSVVDPFMGIGGTLRAAKNLGMKAVGIEIEERYCEIAAQRMSQEVIPLVIAPQLSTLKQGVLWVDSGNGQ
jgi:site-specific DNA-methyltransferase (adenine-specific)